MMLTAMFATATILMLSLCVLFLVRRLGADSQILPVTTDWLTELSIERYRPMMRLLESTDFQYLRAQRGYTAQMGRKLRRERVQAFRGYLHLLEADFRRVAAALHLILAQSSYDRPELATALLQRRVLFGCRIIEVEIRLALFRLGWQGVDGAELIRVFDSMRLDLRTLVPASALAVA